MKKLALVLMMLALITGSAFGAGTVTETRVSVSPDLEEITLSWTGDASNGTVPATTTSAIDGYIVLVVTNPGSTAPTDNYDITLTDYNGVDVMGGTLADRDTADTEQAVPLVGFAYGPRAVRGYLTLNITNQSVASATGTVMIYVQH